jgi:cytochrome c oxidase subunit 2
MAQRNSVSDIDPYIKECLNSLSFDSYMVADDELENKDLRLLVADNPLILPSETHIRLLITAEDVIHS